ncbi:MAG: patatin-like phospholipase family protein [Bacteroidota bacterium]
MKRNHFLLLFWLILFAGVTQNFANKFGIPALFLAPEYRGVVGILSYAILGFSLGAFIMAFNIYTYINHAHRFPFLGTLSRPFFKFCINNFIIPISFIITYVWCSADFLKYVELKGNLEVFWDMLAFVLGNALFIFFAIIYFFPTNKNIFKITGLTEDQFEVRLRRRARRSRGKTSYDDANAKTRWRVDTYLVNPFKVNLARESKHYDAETLQKVFYQNHVNASLFEIIIVVLFFLIGVFQHNDFFVIPAAASACLVFTVVLMAISIIMSRLKGWTFTVLVLTLLVVNWASKKWNFLNQVNYAYGLNYEKPPVDYSLAHIDSLNNDLVIVNSDKAHHERILNEKIGTLNRGTAKTKPKLVVINATGGGLRSTLWTMRSLQMADSITGGQLMDQTALMTGSSGGIIGSSYFRELILRKDSLGDEIYSKRYREQSSNDILNRVLFTLATNDIFIRFRRTQVDGRSYILDRGKTFENQLNRNTENVFNKKLSDYYKPVSAGLIPMIVMAPSVVNDGRRLLISSQPISFLSYTYPDKRQKLNLSNENIEFNRLFAEHDGASLRYTSALRMNASFPYITPNANLPTKPRIEVMDAGLRDNLGTKITSWYLLAFKDWIQNNTSGVIILQIRDTQKFEEPKSGNLSLLKRLTNPIGSFYGNFFSDQDYDMDQLYAVLESSFDVPIEKVPLELRYQEVDEIALSWHLTELEKREINDAINQPHNQEALRRLQELLD